MVIRAYSQSVVILLYYSVVIGFASCIPMNNITAVTPRDWALFMTEVRVCAGNTPSVRTVKGGKNEKIKIYTTVGKSKGRRRVVHGVYLSNHRFGG